MGDPATDARVGGRRRLDGRRQLLIYLAPEVIKEIKKVAVDDDTTASAIADEALREWLRRRKKKAAKTVAE